MCVCVCVYVCMCVKREGEKVYKTKADRQTDR